MNNKIIENLLKDKKVIFFDVGFTLVYPLSHYWFITKRLLDYVGDKASIEELLHAQDVGFEYLLKDHFLKDIDEEIYRLNIFYKIINDTANLGLSDEQILDVAKDRATNMNNFILYDDTIKVLEELSKKYRLGLISDNWPDADNQLNHLGIRKYFETFTYSYKLGAFKPSEILFNDAINKMGCKPNETVFIDDLIENLDASSRLGIESIHACMNKETDVECSYPKIYSLSDLID